MVFKIDEDVKEIIDSFVSQGYDKIENAENNVHFLNFEYNEEIVNSIFRLFHSIKSSAGYLNFENIKNVTQEAEALLDIFKKENIKPEPKHVNVLYQTLDFLRQLIVNVENKLTDRGFETTTALMVHNINECIENLKIDIDKEKKVEKKETVKSVNEINSIPNNSGVSISDLLDLLNKTENSILSAEQNPGNFELVKEIFSNIITINRNSSLLNYSGFENSGIDIPENGSIDKFNKNTFIFLLKRIDDLRQNILKFVSGGGDVSNTVPASIKNLQINYKPLGEILVNMGEVSEDIVEKALEIQHKPLGEILVESGQVRKEIIEKALDIQKNLNPEKYLFSEESRVKEIRIDSTQLDKLFSLVSELIMAEENVCNNNQFSGIIASKYLINICREIQEIMMKMRMIPIFSLFNKMKRLVRDLARKYEKKINFEVSGDNTEAERNIIDQISDTTCAYYTELI